jgi:hypothetical protein
VSCDALLFIVVSNPTSSAILQVAFPDKWA